jgi:hypothetical protein
MEKVDLKEVKRFLAKQAGKEVPVYEGPWLFYYGSVWTYIENKGYVTLTEKQAEEKLKQYHTPRMMEVFYCHLINSETPKPSILKGRRGLQTEEVHSHEEVSDLIYRVTGVKVSEADLRSKQKMMAKDDRPLSTKVRTLIKDSDEKKKHDKEIDRIIKCMELNDPLKRKICLNNNCKTK